MAKSQKGICWWKSGGDQKSGRCQQGKVTPSEYSPGTLQKENVQEGHNGKIPLPGTMRHTMCVLIDVERGQDDKWRGAEAEEVPAGMHSPDEHTFDQLLEIELPFQECCDQQG